MAAMVEISRDSGAWTIDDLERLPDDGRRYELLDGNLLVSPAPVKRHQRVVGSLYLLFTAAAPAELTIYLSPTDWQPDRRTSFQPDLLVVQDDDPDGKNVTQGLVLAVEVLSPSTRRLDLVEKRVKYASAGVPSYWVVDPDPPSLLAFELVGSEYQVVAEAEPEQVVQLERPFPISVRATSLLERDNR